MQIKRIEIIEKDSRAFATFEDGQRLPMHYTSAERVFAMLFKLHPIASDIVNNRLVTTIAGNQVEVSKTYREIFN